MLSRRESRWYSLAWVFIAVQSAASTLLQAQTIDSSAISTTLTMPGALIEELPLDRAIDVVKFLPGVTTDNSGEILVRGGHPGDAAIYLDGVPLLSGFRSLPFFTLSASRNLESRVSPGPNLVDTVRLNTGPLGAALGNAQSGVLSFTSREPRAGLDGELRYESDEPMGSGHSFGLNRLEGRLEGTSGRFGLLLGGMLEGQQSIERGFDASDAPVFVSAGVDTTVTVPSALNDPLADITLVDVYDFAVSRGSCDNLAGTNPQIRDNYGVGCQGARTPFSPVSTYQVLGKLTYQWGRSRFSLLGVADQHQNRNFDYGTLYNAVEATGNRASSSAVILGWTGPLNQREDKPLLLSARLSFQGDREHSGPLSPEGADNTTDPFGGFVVSPLGLRFDFDNFPVDEELVRNYRMNLVGSRRSPYDLENVAQYSPIDRYRNNAYGLYNRDEIAPATFTEAGGPVGLLTLYRENRTLGMAAVSWRTSRYHRVELGGEFTRYSIANYSHELVSSTLSDVYLEHPVRAAAFLQDELSLGDATISAGLRLDYYSTRARRPGGFPRISTHPLFNPSNPEAFFSDDSLFPRDGGHGYLSPRIQAAFAAGPRTVLRAGVAQQAQVPDFRQSLLGINTDLSLTNSSIAAFGTDLDFERTTTFELGAHHQLGAPLSVDISFYSRNVESQIETRLEPRFDPLRFNNVNLRLLENVGKERVRGADVLIQGRVGAALTGWLGYSYQDASSDEEVALDVEEKVPTDLSRPHSVTGALALEVPGDWKPGSVAGTILRNTGLFTVFRIASGTPYTRCSSVEISTLSSESCSGFSPEPPNSFRLPALKQLDLRLVKRFGTTRRFAAYIDARNILNFKNVLTVFSSNGETTNAVEEQFNWSADSADLSSEAETNGAYDPAGTIHLGEGLPDPRIACAGWLNAGSNPAAPNCVYLIRAEERFGNGDHLFDLREQRRASNALYLAVRGPQEFTGPPRRVRIGLELGF